MKTSIIQLAITATTSILASSSFAQGPLKSDAPYNDRYQLVQPVELSLGGALLFTNDNTGATIDDDFLPGSNVADNWGVASVWHAFTISENADVTVDFCGTGFQQPGAFAEYLFLGRPDRGNAREAATLFPSPCGDGNYAMTFTDLSAGTYFLPVGFIPKIAEGTYSITISATVPGAIDHSVRHDISLR